MRKILVTGGAGFIGSHLISVFEKDGYTVTVLDDFSTGKWENLSHTNAVVVDGSVENYSLVEKAAQRCDAIFHLAALVSVPKSIENPELCKSVNEGGTENILNVAEKSGIGYVAFMSSASVYGLNPKIPQSENDPTEPDNPYAQSKVFGETACYKWAERTGGKAACVRLFNSFGPRQNVESRYGAVVSSFFDALIRGRNLHIFGDGMQMRDFIFIHDVVHALVFLMEKNYSGVINLACGKKNTILELARSIKSLSENNIDIVFEEPRKSDIKYSIADVSRLKKLGFHPGYTLMEGLRTTYKWLLCEINCRKI